MYPTDEEIVELSEYFAEKLNKTKGPTAFLIPMQGWSAYDQPEAVSYTHLDVYKRQLCAQMIIIRASM